jgi:ornithine cyclodeaminase
VIGAGAQAETQIDAAARVLKLEEIRVFSRSAEGRTAFAEAAVRRTGVTTSAVESAEKAVTGADVVILATTSRSPVIQAGWLKAGAHINTLGPRGRSGSEVGAELAERAALIATDSPEQIAALPEPHVFAGTAAMARILDLSALVAGGAPARTDPDAISLFCSVGLAGTEVAVAAAIIAAARRN